MTMTNSSALLLPTSLCDVMVVLYTAFGRRSQISIPVAFADAISTRSMEKVELGRV